MVGQDLECHPLLCHHLTRALVQLTVVDAKTTEDCERLQRNKRNNQEELTNITRGFSCYIISATRRAEEPIRCETFGSDDIGRCFFSTQ